MNKTPYYFTDNWKNYEIKYLEFNNYKFIKDLSYKENNCKSIILLFEFEDKKILRGFSEGIVFPQINYFDIYNLHVKKKEKKIQQIFDYLNNIFEKYNIVDTKIYQDPVLCITLGYSIFDLINNLKFNLKYKLEMFINYDDSIKEIEKKMEGGGTRSVINGFNKNKPEFNIYFKKIEENVIKKFKNKHIELANKKTKDDFCWDITEKIIKDGEGLLLESNNNFVLFSVSENYSYYSINACSKKDKIVTFLLYEGIKWLNLNNYKFIHMGTYHKYCNDIKNVNISKFKKTFSNKIYTQYYLELVTV